MRLAVFDIDGTLVRGSTERMFWAYLARHGKQGPRQILAYLLFWVRYLPVGGIHTAQKNKAYLSGLRVVEVEALAAAFVAERLMHVLYEPAVQRLRQHLNRGDAVLLLSGTLECIALALAQRLGVSRVCATLCHRHDGIFMAQPPDQHPFGDTKLALARQLCRELGIDLRQVSAYGNSRHDLALLDAVRTPVAVLPDATLLSVARDRDWEIIAGTERMRSLSS